MDPFAGSFDEIYKQAGADNLVKRPMGGMARQKPKPSPPPSVVAGVCACLYVCSSLHHLVTDFQVVKNWHARSSARCTASLLGQSPKPPPPDVPALKESDLEDFL
eukprot:480972-Pelagomonas_calceolata.AAC.1